MDNLKWVFDAEALREKKESDNKISIKHAQKLIEELFEFLLGLQSDGIFIIFTSIWWF